MIFSRAYVSLLLFAIIDVTLLLLTLYAAGVYAAVFCLRRYCRDDTLPLLFTPHAIMLDAMLICLRYAIHCYCYIITC